MSKKLTKNLIIYLSLLIALSASGCGFFDAYARKGNMRQAQREIDLLMKDLEYDVRFTNLTMAASEDNVGRDIIVQGIVPDQPSLDYLKFLLRIRLSPEFNVKYMVETRDGSKGAG